MGINHLKDGKREGDAGPEGNFQLLHEVNEIWLEINPVEFPEGSEGLGVVILIPDCIDLGTKSVVMFNENLLHQMHKNGDY